MRLRHFVPYVLLTACSITYAIPPNLQTSPIATEIKETIQEFLQDRFTYEEFIQLLTDLENGTDLEETYDLEEINDFLACIAHLGTLIQDSEEAEKLDESILELLDENDDDIAQSDLPAWYHQVYFPNQLPPSNIEICGFNIGKPLKKAGHAVKKGAKKTYKLTKSSVKKAAKLPKKAVKTIAKPFKKTSKKSWEKTKKFIKKHKKAIIIGAVVVAIAALVITFGPEISTLMAGLIPAFTDKQKETKSESIASQEASQQSYTEDNFTVDCIELIQEQLLESGLNNLTPEEYESFSILKKIKDIGSGISHQLIDGLDSTVQTLALLSDFPEQLQKLDLELSQSEETLYSRGIEAANNAIIYLHEKTDEMFDTTLAQCYTAGAKTFKDEFGIEYYEGFIPLPGSSILGESSPKELLKKFTKNTYRNHLKKAQPLAHYAEVEAHHVFPQAKELQKKFNKHGINVHDPQYLVWWEKNAHRANSLSYNLEWEDFFQKTPNITKEKILEKGKQLMEKYGIETLY